MCRLRWLVHLPLPSMRSQRLPDWPCWRSSSMVTFRSDEPLASLLDIFGVECLELVSEGYVELRIGSGGGGRAKAEDQGWCGG